MTPLDDAWLPYYAGFFDGEGCVSIERRTNGYGLHVVVGQIDPSPLRLMQQCWTGAIRRSAKRHENHRDFYTWSLTGPRARIFLEDVLPWLVVKKSQAQIAIAFQTDVEDAGRLGADRSAIRAVWFEQIRALKHLNYDETGKGTPARG